RAVQADRHLALSQRNLQAHRLAGELGQHCFDATRILVADPIELEAVGHAHRHHGIAGAAVGHVGRRQRADPGIELLFGQFGRESLAAALPEVSAHVVENSLWSGRIVHPPQRPKAWLSTVSRPRSRPAPSRIPPSKSLTLKGVFGVILGFPNAWRGAAWRPTEAHKPEGPSRTTMKRRP